jgi:anti-sigma regulatory factor (Ser/Thr protein kinase)
VSIIRQSGEHLLRLINDVLDLVKMDARKMKLFTDELVLPPFLQLIQDIISLKAQQKGLEFVCRADPELPHCVRADETRLRQVLLNLLSNAVQFTDRGEVRLEVRRAGPNRLRFSVSDTGIGIPRDQLDRLFQPFEQISTLDRGAHGTGLGLAICSSFVRLMGSEIHVESEVGRGSTFWFELELPVVDSRSSVPTAPSRPAPLRPPASEDSRLVCDVPSPAELTHLHELALQGHMSQIAQEAARIARLDPRYQAFAAKVQTLAARYESRAVLRLIENICTANSGSSA